MLAVEKLKRISASLLRHSTSLHHHVTSSPPCGDVEDNQGQNGGTLKAVRRRTPPIDNYSSTVVPISVCQSAYILPVTSQKPINCRSDDVITPTHERCVTSFGGAAAYRPSYGDDERRNTSASRNYFGGANAYGGTVNVNGVCFSVYGTLPRNLIRRRAKQGQGQGQSEVGDRKLFDALSDHVCTLRRHPAPSPPKRTNSIKTDLQQRPSENDLDLQRPAENDFESTLTRRHRETTSGECEANEKASDNRGRMQTTIARTQEDYRNWCAATENGLSLTFTNNFKDTDRIQNGRTPTPTEPLTGSEVDERREDSAGENSENTVVLDQEFDGGTVKRRHKPSSDNNRHSTDSYVDFW